MMLEDESGRLHVTGKALEGKFVTGCILAALGTEEEDGTFHVIATQCADLPRQPPRWEQEDLALPATPDTPSQPKGAGKIAIVSGLDIKGEEDDGLMLDQLVEFLTGEASGGSTQATATKITRLILAGDSLFDSSPILSRDEVELAIEARHEGEEYESYNPAATVRLDELLTEILPEMPITLVPGSGDPANVTIPQQPVHHAFFPTARLYSERFTDSSPRLDGFDAVTNPWAGDIDGYRILATGGQAVLDLLKYVERVPAVDAMEMMLRWRCVAPTAPDTLWCYPFQDDDPLLLEECPHMYIAGCQKKFGKKIIQDDKGQKVLLVSVPRFSDTGKVVLVDLETWDVEVVRMGPKKRSRHEKHESIKKRWLVE